MWLSSIFLRYPNEPVLYPPLFAIGLIAGLFIGSPALVYKYVYFFRFRDPEPTALGAIEYVLSGIGMLVAFPLLAVSIPLGVLSYLVFYAGTAFALYRFWWSKDPFGNVFAAYGNPSLEDDN